MSNLEANKVIRVLSDRRLKYTIHLLMRDGSSRELQAIRTPKLDFNVEARSILLVLPTEDYTATIPICEWKDVLLMQVEENPQ